MDAPHTQAPAWCGEFEIPEGTRSQWRVGPVTIWIERNHGEWRIATELSEGDDDVRVEYTANAPETDLMARKNVVRIGTSAESNQVTLEPRLADRDVVTKPLKPFYVAAGEQVSVFVGSPLWLAVGYGNPARTMHEFPLVRPSDTWFGDNTMVGEVCYASRTQCRLRLENLPARPHRAATKVLVNNQSDTPLLLTRMKLPVQYLPLYYDEDGVFWTRDITVTNDAVDKPAAIRHRDEPPALARSPRLISQARTYGGENLVMKVFSLFR